MKALKSAVHFEWNKLSPKRQKEPRKTIEETSGCVRPEQVNK
jgi:hypothetical protein